VYRIDWTTRAESDAQNIERAGLKKKVADIIGIIEHNPYENTPGHYFEKITSRVKNTYTRRIDYHNRFVYTVRPNIDGDKDRAGNPYDGIIRIVRMWGHP